MSILVEKNIFRHILFKLKPYVCIIKQQLHESSESLKIRQSPQLSESEVVRMLMHNIGRQSARKKKEHSTKVKEQLTGMSARLCPFFFFLFHEHEQCPGRRKAGQKAGGA